MKEKVEAFDLMVDWLADVPEDTKLSLSNNGVEYTVEIDGLSVSVAGGNLSETLDLAYEIWNGTIRVERK